MRTKIIIELVSSLTSIRDLNNVRQTATSTIEQLLGMMRPFRQFLLHFDTGKADICLELEQKQSNIFYCDNFIDNDIIR
mgnify:CR=1 FL=1